jgi:hypothetical protein
MTYVQQDIHRYLLDLMLDLPFGVVVVCYTAMCSLTLQFDGNQSLFNFKLIEKSFSERCHRDLPWFCQC